MNDLMFWLLRNLSANVIADLNLLRSAWDAVQPLVEQNLTPYQAATRLAFLALMSPLAGGILLGRTCLALIFFLAAIFATMPFIELIWGTVCFIVKPIVLIRSIHPAKRISTRRQLAGTSTVSWRVFCPFAAWPDWKTKNKPSLQFLELPAEVRNRIINLALTPSSMFHVHIRHCPFTGYSKSSRPTPAILLTCRKLRNEYSAMHYRRVTVTLGSLSACSWLESIGPEKLTMVHEIRCNGPFEQVPFRSQRSAHVWRRAIDLYFRWRGIVIRREALKVGVQVAKSESVWTSEPLQIETKTRLNTQEAICGLVFQVAVACLVGGCKELLHL